MNIGHPEALREETPDFRYIDVQNQKLKEALQPYGIQLELLDSFIEKLEADGENAAGQLRNRRRYALYAFNNLRKFQELGLEAWRSYIEVIFCQMHLYKLGGALVPFESGRAEGRRIGAESNKKKAADAKEFALAENQKILLDNPRAYKNYRANLILKAMDENNIRMVNNKSYSKATVERWLDGT